MPKTKLHVLNTYRNIIRAIRAGRIPCLPVFTRFDRIGVEPSIVYVLQSGVKVQQPFRIASKLRVLRDGSLAKPRKRKSNRVDIPPGLLNAMYVLVGPRSPLQEIVSRNDPDELREWFILRRNNQPMVKIFQFVRNISAALRQTEHIFAGYNIEMTQLREKQLELSEKLRRHRSGVETIPDEEALATRLELAKANLRVAEITEISTDRAARDLNLQFVARASFDRLQFYAKALENLATSVRGMGSNFHRQATVDYVRSLDTELTFFASKEISPYRGAARRSINKILRDEEEVLSAEDTATLLTRAGRSLTRGSVKLTQWAETLGVEESQEAQDMRYFVAPRQLTFSL